MTPDATRNTDAPEETVPEDSVDTVLDDRVSGGPDEDETLDAADEDQDTEEALCRGRCERLIEDSQLFKALDQVDRLHLLDSGSRITFEPGEVILREGEEGDSFYLLEEGEVEVSTERDGRTVTLATLTEGAIFGEVPAFSDKPRTATVTAASLVEVVRFRNDELKALLEKRPEVRDELQAMIFGRAQDTIEKLTRDE